MHEPGSRHRDAIPQKTSITLLCYCRPADYFSHKLDVNNYCYGNMHTHQIFLYLNNKIWFFFINQKQNKCSVTLLFLLHCCDHVSVVYPSLSGAPGALKEAGFGIQTTNLLLTRLHLAQFAVR